MVLEPSHCYALEYLGRLFCKSLKRENDDGNTLYLYRFNSDFVE